MYDELDFNEFHIDDDDYFGEDSDNLDEDFVEMLRISMCIDNNDNLDGLNQDDFDDSEDEDDFEDL